MSYDGFVIFNNERHCDIRTAALRFCGGIAQRHFKPPLRRRRCLGFPVLMTECCLQYAHFKPAPEVCS